ncbi:hypothetical protein CHS0354_025909 [Potamilus streckersoni]|uniref:Globin domain-containing protein n=1 Tax=Potamilus streckersoni TaxID=2493646 RepID=A0AAE0T3V8_9BIVA|nr:hypothetical protein CHS0354_025909 [Potamilus streckersoni]
MGHAKSVVSILVPSGGGGGCNFVERSVAGNSLNEHIPPLRRYITLYSKNTAFANFQMGCSSSLISRSRQKNGTTSHSISSCTKKNRHQFDENQIGIIKKTWRHFEGDMSRVGCKVFLQIFLQYPALKQLFPFRYINGEALLQDPSFKAHAFRFMQAVGAAIDNIDNLDDALVPLLLGLGKQHTTFMDFKEEYFRYFSESMMLVWKEELKSKFDEVTSLTWRLLFTFIMDTIQEGFRQAQQQNNSYILVVERNGETREFNAA